MDVGERTRGEIEPILGEDALRVGITDHVLDRALGEKLGHRHDQRPDDGQWVAALLIDVGSKQIAHPVECLDDVAIEDRDVDIRCAESIAERPLDPTWDVFDQAMDQILGETVEFRTVRWCRTHC